MNFVEAMELLRALSAFSPKSLRVRPKFTFYDAEKEGYVVCVKEDSVLSDYFSYLKEIVKTRDLRIRKQEGYLFIHSQ
jgi:hypothetical protein